MLRFRWIASQLNVTPSGEHHKDKAFNLKFSCRIFFIDGYLWSHMASWVWCFCHFRWWDRCVWFPLTWNLCSKDTFVNVSMCITQWNLLWQEIKWSGVVWKILFSEEVFQFWCGLFLKNVNKFDLSNVFGWTVQGEKVLEIYGLEAWVNK